MDRGEIYGLQPIPIDSFHDKKVAAMLVKWSFLNDHQLGSNEVTPNLELHGETKRDATSSLFSSVSSLFYVNSL